MAAYVPPPATTFSTIAHFNDGRAMSPSPVASSIWFVRRAPRNFVSGSWAPACRIGSARSTCRRCPIPRGSAVRAAVSPAPYLTLTHRLVVVRWRDPDGRPRLLLFEPTDVELARRTPYFARLSERTPDLLSSACSRATPRRRAHATCAGSASTRLTSTGSRSTICTRRMSAAGSARTAAGAGSLARAAAGSGATAAEREADRAALPSSKSADATCTRCNYPGISRTRTAALRPDGLLPIDGDVLIGPGVALLSTPGHTIGNQTLVVNTETGIWASSENVIATECLTPEHSRIPGMRRFARAWEQEVVLNANTLEDTARQYNSCVLEKSIVDVARANSRLSGRVRSGSCTTGTMLSPGTSPTFTHSGIFHGTLTPAGAVRR